MTDHKYANPIWSTCLFDVIRRRELFVGFSNLQTQRIQKTDGSDSRMLRWLDGPNVISVLTSDGRFSWSLVRFSLDTVHWTLSSRLHRLSTMWTVWGSHIPSIRFHILHQFAFFRILRHQLAFIVYIAYIFRHPFTLAEVGRRSATLSRDSLRTSSLEVRAIGSACALILLHSLLHSCNLQSYKTNDWVLIDASNYLAWSTGHSSDLWATAKS